jgi:hypothetical protein
MNRPGKLLAVALVPVFLTTGFLTVGCGDPNKSPASAPASSGGSDTAPATSPQPASDTVSSPGISSAVPTTQGVTKIPQDKLAIGDYMPPLDDDRVEIAKPQGWQAMPRDSAFLTRFYRTNRNGLPRIEITVEPRTYGDLATVTSENVEQFVKLVAERLGDLELVEKVIPLQIGDTPCARYVGRVDLKLSAGQTISAERQRLLVLQDGRLYTIDLLVMPKTLRQSRDAAYAVCAGLRFGGGQQPPATGELLPE